MRIFLFVIPMKLVLAKGGNGSRKADPLGGSYKWIPA